MYLYRKKRGKSKALFREFCLFDSGAVVNVSFRAKIPENYKSLSL